MMSGAAWNREAVMLTTERLESIRLIQDSAAAFASKGDLARVRRQRFGDAGFDRAVWKDMCAAGWSGLRVSEARGGSELGMMEYGKIAAELGAALAPEPYVASAIAALLDDATLARFLTGEFVVLPATQESANAIAPQTTTRFSSGKLFGTKLFVADANLADAFLVSTDSGLALARRDSEGVSVVTRPCQDGGRLGTVRFDGAAADPLAGSLDAAYEEMTLGVAFYLFGAMERAFEITLDYVKSRKQFGQAIGDFQTVRHRLADLKIHLEVTRATLDETAGLFDSAAEPSELAMAVSRAKARASTSAMTAANLAVQLHGGMGYTDEADIGLYVRKILTLCNRFGSAKAHRRRFVALGGASSWMEDSETESASPPQDAAATADYNEMTDEAFRAMARAWIEQNYPKELPRFATYRSRCSATMPWYQRLAKQGWLAPGWPREYGGMELSAAKRLIMIEEMDRFGCSRFADQGVIMVGPLLMNFGTREQRERFLPKILSGEHIWAQGYSEPGAGSDLASLRTSAELVGDEWVVNGQKTWTTLADDANWFYILARTDKTAKKQEGISVLLIPASAPGVTVRPFKNLAMHDEFCDIFFDNVRVPKDSLVGPVNKGWGIAKALLGFERIFLGSLAQSSKAAARLYRIARGLGVSEDPSFGDSFAELVADIKDHAALYEIYLDKVRRREELGPDVSMLKINQTELYRRITQLIVDISGEHAGYVEGGEQADEAAPSALWIQALPATIYGGCSEVQRDIVSRQVLKM